MNCGIRVALFPHPSHENSRQIQPQTIAARAALPCEKDGLRAVYTQAMREHIEAIWGWDQAWQDLDFDQAFHAAQTYVIEKRSSLLGYFQIDRQQHHSYLRMLIIKPEAQRLGLGASVLTRIVDIARGRGQPLLLRVFKINHDAKRFYEREGWTVKLKRRRFF